MTWIFSSWGRRFILGGFSALGVLLLLKLGALQPLEQLGYQLLFHLRGEQPWDDRIVLITIDDASLAKIGRFPWSRQQYVKLLQVLNRSDASVIVFDLLFSEPSSDDGALATAMSQQGHVILSQAWDAEGEPLLPVPSLQQNALGVGHILAQQNSDGIVRQILPQVQGVPALGITAIQAYNLLQAEVPLPDLHSPLQLNWVGRSKTIQQYSFAEVVQGKINPQVFSNKIVLVGVTAIGLDPVVMPFDRNPPTSSVLLHATLIQNLLDQATLKPLSTSHIFLLFLLGGPLLGWHLSGRGWVRQVAAVAGLWAAWGLLGVLLVRVNILPPIVAPLLLFLTTGTVTGVYDRLRESAMLRHQIQHFRQDDALKQEFFRTASHELRAPVVNIHSAITLLRMSDTDEDREEYLKILEEECQTEFALINDLLDFQRLSAQPPSRELETYDLRDWLTEVVAPFQMRAEMSQQVLQSQVESSCTDLTLDWHSLRRILTELLNNACKYTPVHGLIQVTLRAMDSQIELLVSNSGVSLPEAELQRLFQPFYRNVDVDYRQQGGTGLGLAIVKRLAEHLNGDIEATSQADSLTFTVRVPLAQDCSSVIEPLL